MTSCDSPGNKHCLGPKPDDNIPKPKSDEATKDLKDPSAVHLNGKEHRPKSVGTSSVQVRYMDTIGPAIAEILRLCQQHPDSDDKVMELIHEILYYHRKVFGVVQG